MNTSTAPNVASSNEAPITCSGAVDFWAQKSAAGPRRCIKPRGRGVARLAGLVEPGSNLFAQRFKPGLSGRRRAKRLAAASAQSTPAQPPVPATDHGLHGTAPAHSALERLSTTPTQRLLCRRGSGDTQPKYNR